MFKTWDFAFLRWFHLSCHIGTNFIQNIYPFCRLLALALFNHVKSVIKYSDDCNYEILVHILKEILATWKEWVSVCVKTVQPPLNKVNVMTQRRIPIVFS